MEEVTLTVSAGEHARKNCPVWVDLDPGISTDGNPVLKNASGAVVPCQALSENPSRICFIVDQLDKGAAETFTLSSGDVLPAQTSAGSCGMKGVLRPTRPSPSSPPGWRSASCSPATSRSSPPWCSTNSTSAPSTPTSS